MLRRRLLTAALAASLASCSSAQKPPVKGEVGGIVVLPVKPSVFVRATFDSDASSLIGAFIPDDVADGDLDESQAARTRCSDFIHAKAVPAQGEVEELFGASSGVSGKVGVKGVAYFKGERTNSSALRIKYSAKQKLMADVDTKGLAECCTIAPDQCAGRYITSVLMGDGKIYAATEQAEQAGVEAEGSMQHIPIAGDVMFKDGVKWERKTEFAGQYFAFSLQRANVGKAPVAMADDCSWANKVPKSLDGSYFVGISDPVESERVAHDQAMKNARSQVVKYISEWLDEASKSSTHLGGALSGVEGTLEETQTQEALSQGMAKLVKDERWCPAETVETPKGSFKVVRVLAFFPKTEEKSAAKLQLTNLIEILKTKGQLTPDREKALRAALAEMK